MNGWKTGILAALGLLGACRNTDLPTLPASADGAVVVAPDVAIQSPAANSLTGDSTFVSLSADALVGIAQVTLSCGTTVLATWTAAPFQGTVDLTPCELGVTPRQSNGSTLFDLTLTAHAVAQGGGATDVTLPVTLDATTAGLTTDAPSRVLPRTQVQFHVFSDHALFGDPVVRLGDQLGSVQQAPPLADGGIVYAVTVTTPGLGADLYPDASVPLGALQDTEELIGLSVDARTLNGNTSSLSVPLRLSRVLWELPVNGTLPSLVGPSQSVNVPRVTDAGLVVPVSGTPVLVTFDGTLVQASAFAQSPQVLAIAPSGRVLYSPDGGSDRLAFDAVTQQQIPGAFPMGLFPDSVVGDAVCQTASGGNGAGGTFDCYDLSTGTHVQHTLPPANGTNFGSISGEVSSGTSWFAPNYPLSSSATNAFLTLAPDGGVVATTGYVNAGSLGCSFIAQNGAPVGDGTFLFFFQETCTYSSRVWWIGADGAPLGSYFAPALSASAVSYSDSAVAQTSDRQLFTLQNQGTSTTFRLWPSDGGTSPTAQVDIPGSFNTMGSAGDDAVSDPQSIDAMLTSGGAAYSVASFDATLRPRYLYRYPRATQSPGDLALYAAATGPLFVVDARNGWVVALQR